MKSKLHWGIIILIFFLVFQDSRLYAFPSLSHDLKITAKGTVEKYEPVSGKVTDEKGNPLAGVTVALKGTTIGSSTDSKGNFSINVGKGQVIVFSFVGYKSKEIQFDGQSFIEVQLQLSSLTLEDVVINIGYGTRKKIDLTGSVSTVNQKVLEANAVGNISDALQGSAPGVNVTTSNLPGNDAKIRIRGLGTINNNNPLWVVDGVPVTEGPNNISPSEIESITVLKDAASTAIYGARGANGVILVTTVQGKKGSAPQVKFNARTGLARNTKQYDLLNVKEYGEMLWLQSKNSGVAPNHPAYGSGPEPTIPKYLLPAGENHVNDSLYNIVSFPITEANPNGTDWFSEVFKPSITQQYSVSVSGGSEKTTYAFSMGALNEGGIVRYTGFNRYTLSANVNSNVSKWFEVGENLRLAYTNNKGLQQEGESGAMGTLAQLSAIMPVYDIKGNFAPVSRLTGFDPLDNPVGDLKRGKDFTQEVLSMDGNVHSTISFLKNFSYKTFFGFSINRGYNNSPLNANPDSYQARSFDQLTNAANEVFQWNFTNTLDYFKKFNQTHTVEVLLGTEAINNESRNFSATRIQYLLTNSDYYVLDAGQGTQSNSGNASDWSTFSYFGRVHYGYLDRYLVDAVFRRDGSSRFGSLNRYGNFPSFALAWVASDENFLASTNKWMNYLKIRASWGESGNDQIGNYNGFTTFSTNPSFSNYPMSGSNNSYTSGFQSLAFGNPNAKWETTTSTNIGFDATFFNRLNLTIDLWQRNTSDMLYPKGIPSVVGQANIPSVNIGDMQNRGLDLQINFGSDRLKKHSLIYDLTFNFSHFKNKIVKLSDVAGEKIIGDLYRGAIYTRAQSGTSFPEFYGYKVIGIFQTESEVDKYPPFGTYNAPGHFKFADVNGDGKIDEGDQTFIGTPFPDFTVGFTGDVQYKQFDLTADFYASVGNDIVNVVRRSLDFNFFQWNRGKTRLYESWGSPYLKDNKDAKMPIAELNDATDMLPSSYFIEDGSYLRLQTLQLGYSLPKPFLDKIRMNKIRVYIMATNVFTITKYSGLDPQIQTSDNQLGIDFGNWPTPKRYLFGLNVTL